MNTVTEILVRRGLASSLEEAVAMVKNGEVRTADRHTPNPTEPDELFRVNIPITLKTPRKRLSDAKRRDAIATLAAQGAAQELPSAALIIEMKSPNLNMPAAKSSCDHASVDRGAPTVGAPTVDNEPLTTAAGDISQVAIEMLFIRRRKLQEIEEPLAALLARGTRVEYGAHKAELKAVRDEFGAIALKVFTS